MPDNIVTVNNTPNNITTMAEMKHGQIGVVLDRNYAGEVVVCFHDRIYNLNCRLGSTWDRRPGNTNQVRILPTGATVTITINNEGN